jgi:tetratricopeptide (TPR) repeat protein
MSARARTALVLGAVLCALAGCRSAGRGGLEPPAPDTAGAEPLVVERVAAARDRVLGARDSAEAWGELGMVLDAHHMCKHALVCYAEARRLDPANFKWPYLQANCMLDTPPSEVVAVLRQACDLRPDFAPACLRLARLLMTSSHEQEAERLFARVSESDPGNASAWLGLGQIALARGDLARARETLERAAGAGPDSRAVLASLARVYARLGLAAEAQEVALEAKDALRDTPLDDEVLVEVFDHGATAYHLAQQGKARLERGELDEAIARLRRSLATRPEQAPARVDLGRALILSGDESAGIAELEHANRLVPEIVDVEAELGTLRARRDSAP